MTHSGIRMTDEAPDDEEPEPAALMEEFPEARDADHAVRMDQFILRGGLVDAWYETGLEAEVLVVSFDNLSSVGQTNPPRPWLRRRVLASGASLLGVMASRKDWYRNPDTAPLIIALREAGLFARYRRVVFVGASMGGFAALAFAPLVPGAAVLAFSPQTTLNRTLAPFEERYPYGFRKWDWQSPAQLDGAVAGAEGREVTLVYDPQVPEDRAHALRVTGAAVRHVLVPMTGHRAIRQLVKIDALQPLLDGVIHQVPDWPGFWRAMRRRRGEPMWQRELVAVARRRGHLKLLAGGVNVLLAADPGNAFLQREALRLRRALRQARRQRRAAAHPPAPGTE
jgi:hypothetical protein